ncbi:NAD(P)-dependent oxidoreductase [Atopococcus tabaci]|uniref:NAD(P)-dependent oxidoreductase n=1 Tax=Atopococcus tabaci TaxID=269774 RepID=UPI0024094375|nr:NAD(P)-dependent oxidoreductase [Atopococcus tabaci]
MDKTIGFIGTGVMGSSIVRHLLRSGYTVNVYNRTKSKTDDLVRRGAIWWDTPADVTKHSDVIFTMVGFPSDVEEVYFDEYGIFEAGKSGQVVVDLTTSTPTLAQRIDKEAVSKGMLALDAPVSGGDLGAQKGTLTVMVGGSQEAHEQIKPLFDTFSSAAELQGPAGSGQHTKMANQIMIAGTMTGMTEMLVYADAAGLDLKKVIHTLNAGAAQNWSLANYALRILKQDYSPGFFVKHFLKDLKIALDEAEKLSLDLPATKQAKQLYEQLQEKGHGDDGTQALIKLWRPEGKRS